MITRAIEDVAVELTVVLGQTEMPISQLLKMGRGAVIDLDADHDDPVMIYAHGELIAKGEIILSGDKIAINITESVKSYQR